MRRLSQNRKWIFWVLAAAFAVQLYFVQELLAIVLLAAVVCVVFGAFVGAFLLLHRFGTRAVGLFEMALQPIAGVSKKLLRRPHSQTAP
jgi:hypothetical protein